MSEFGSERHRALIEEIASFYSGDERIRAIGVFGSLASRTWHELSDVDLDVVIADDAVVRPRDEVHAIFGARAAVVLDSADSADIVLDSLEELSIRWHTLATTSPNIATTVHVVVGTLSTAEVRAAGAANRVSADRERLLETLVRQAVGAAKAIERQRMWSAVVAIQEMRYALTSLRAHRDSLELDPGQPADALSKVIAETRAAFDLDAARTELLDRVDPDRAAKTTNPPA